MTILTVCVVSMPQFLATATRDIPTFAGAKYTDNNLEEGTQCLTVENGTLSFFLGCDHVCILGILERKHLLSIIHLQPDNIVSW
jgi:hypothetical protein